jgi:hypothetical protein
MYLYRGWHLVIEVPSPVYRERQLKYSAEGVANPVLSQLRFLGDLLVHPSEGKSKEQCIQAALV